MINFPKSILLIQLGDIGDVVLSFPCVRALKETYPEAKIVVAVRQKAAELIEMCQWADGCISVGKEVKGFWQNLMYQKRFFLGLREYRFDVAFDLRTGTRGAILALLSGARQRIAFYAEDGKLWRNRVFSSLIDPVPYIHMVDVYLNLFSAFKITTENKRPCISVSAKQKEIKGLLDQINLPTGLPYIAIQPFSLWDYKNWPIEKFVALIDLIESKYNVVVLICGGEPDTERAEQLVKKCKHRNVFNLAGKTSLALYAALLGVCDMLISVDSAGTHIAAAVDTPTVTIYGPSPSKGWAPRGDNHLVVTMDLPCVPCGQTGCGNSMRSRCLEELDVGKVFSAVQVVLSNCQS